MEPNSWMRASYTTVFKIECKRSIENVRKKPDIVYVSITMALCADANIHYVFIGMRFCFSMEMDI